MANKKLSIKITLSEENDCHDVIECLLSKQPEQYGLKKGSGVKARILRVLIEAVDERKKIYGNQTSLSPQDNIKQDDGSEDSFGAF